MFLLFRGLPVLIELGLLVYCLIDCLQTPAEAVRNLSKGWWIVLIIIMPVVGGIAWLVAGRPQRTASGPYKGNHGPAPWPSTRTAGFPEYERPGGHRVPIGPDDDPRFLAELSQVNSEQEQTLKQWEADLKRREAELRRRDTGGSSAKSSADEGQADEGDAEGGPARP